VCLVRATREKGRVRLGASPRGTLALFRFSRALALVRGRDFVVPEDIRSGAVPVLAHRILLRPDLWGEGIDGEDVLEEILERLPVPGALS
jgi:MoxR-like ATPase